MFGATENKPKKELIQMLVRAKYDSDPVKAWKEAQKKLQVSTRMMVTFSFSLLDLKTSFLRSYSVSFTYNPISINFALDIELNSNFLRKVEVYLTWLVSLIHQQLLNNSVLCLCREMAR